MGAESRRWCFEATSLYIYFRFDAWPKGTDISATWLSHSIGPKALDHIYLFGETAGGRIHPISQSIDRIQPPPNSLILSSRARERKGTGWLRVVINGIPVGQGPTCLFSSDVPNGGFPKHRGLNASHWLAAKSNKWVSWHRMLIDGQINLRPQFSYDRTNERIRLSTFLSKKDRPDISPNEATGPTPTPSTTQSSRGASIREGEYEASKLTH